MMVKEVKEFICKNYMQSGFTKENSYSMKHWKKNDLLVLAAKLTKNTWC